jgi:hypothetical protein
MPSKRLLIAFLAVFSVAGLLSAVIYLRTGVNLFVPFTIGASVPLLMAWVRQRKKK